MEDFRIDLVVGEGPSARSISIDLSPFTLVGATTRTGLLTAPLRSRFGSHFRLDFYGDDELAAVIRRSAGLLAIDIDPDAATEVAGRARGLRALPTGCCAASVTTLRFALRVASRAPWCPTHWR